jgi:hypothetical protein
VLAAERRRGAGRERVFRFTAAESELDIGGHSVRTWAYNEEVPGPLVRVTAGDVLDLTLANRLPETTTLHSHGVRLRCDMDGVPDLTQRAIHPDSDFRYRFTVAHPGTYLLHSHVGMQPDRALYAPLVVEDPKEPLSYDKEWVVVLDDWLDGVEGSTPENVLEQLKPGGAMDMGGMAMGPGHPTKEHPAPSKKATGPNRVLHKSHSRMLNGEGGSGTPTARRAAASPTRTTSSTAGCPTRRRCSAAAPGNGCGCASSTPVPRPPSGWRWATTG